MISMHLLVEFDERYIKEAILERLNRVYTGAVCTEFEPKNYQPAPAVVEENQAPAPRGYVLIKHKKATNALSNLRRLPVERDMPPHYIRVDYVDGTSVHDSGDNLRYPFDNCPVYDWYKFGNTISFPISAANPQMTDMPIGVDRATLYEPEQSYVVKYLPTGIMFRVNPAFPPHEDVVVVSQIDEYDVFTGSRTTNDYKLLPRYQELPWLLTADTARLVVREGIALITESYMVISAADAMPDGHIEIKEAHGESVYDKQGRLLPLYGECLLFTNLMMTFNEYMTLLETGYLPRLPNACSFEPSWEGKRQLGQVVYCLRRNTLFISKKGLPPGSCPVKMVRDRHTITEDHQVSGHFARIPVWADIFDVTLGYL